MVNLEHTLHLDGNINEVTVPATSDLSQFKILLKLMDQMKL